MFVTLNFQFPKIEFSCLCICCSDLIGNSWFLVSITCLQGIRGSKENCILNFALPFLLPGLQHIIHLSVDSPFFGVMRVVFLTAKPRIDLIMKESVSLVWKGKRVT
ncbi:hypothetical protein MTR67_014639 [Solanum verrucosum]|uniref:Uncharacterized protein n=1 Tax=Solanum verrucosum TaxID=315347 RepID=A0AAF0QCL0_SOLVR|nr:hypothetical protein MTR67_014639 [Solanum verrucosum]